MNLKRNPEALTLALVSLFVLGGHAQAQVAGPCKMIVKSDQVEFEGCNVFVKDGQADNETGGPTNGRGNLIVGYADLTGAGSHNMSVGTGHTFSSYGGLVSGYANTVSEKFASVTGGKRNEAAGYYASISGGHYNRAGGDSASVSGGQDNLAAGYAASVGGGYYNEAAGPYSSVVAGYNNTASGSYAAVLGGRYNTASGTRSVVLGGVSHSATAADEVVP